MTVYLDDGDFRLYHGDALETLKTLPDESVHMCVTSPPFYGLRDYGTGTWEGGEAQCDHLGEPFRTKAKLNENWGEGYADVKNAEDRQPFKAVCGKCGARRVDQQIGLEETPDQWVAKLVDVFREVRRVLRSDGTCWVEVGDSYAGSWTAQSHVPGSRPDVISATSIAAGPQKTRTGSIPAGAPYKPKDLIGAPWLLAFALRADGWWLRSDVVWSRPNPMPESVTDRPTKSHSYLFLLSKGARYFFDQEAVREPAEYGRSVWNGDQWSSSKGVRGGYSVEPGNGSGGRNVRSVWEIATQPYPEAHFATYPEELVRRCILAGTSERGCCPECGAPWQRQVEVSHTEAGRGNNNMARKGQNPDAFTGRPYETRMLKATSTLGWHPSCGHGLDPVPCTVLDPFGGSGTTALVARKHGRRSVLVELSETYCELAARRLSQLSLLA